MTEEIQAVLETDILVSRERGLFSTPTEIQNHLNRRLDSSYSTRAIAECLKRLGWKVSGKQRVKRQGKACNFYYRQGDIQSKALLSPCAKTNTQSESKSKDTSVEGESLSEIDKTFKVARRDKERNLSQIRHVEISTSKVKRDHLEISLAKERSELIRKVEVRRVWQESLMYIKQGLYTLPSRFSERFASETNDQVIFDELTTEIDALLTRFARGGERAVTQEDEDTETENE